MFKTVSLLKQLFNSLFVGSAGLLLPAGQGVRHIYIYIYIYIDIYICIYHTLIRVCCRAVTL